jgi:hypothetical protein
MGENVSVMERILGKEKGRVYFSIGKDLVFFQWARMNRRVL